jgi:hypothetical protein
MYFAGGRRAEGHKKRVVLSMSKNVMLQLHDEVVIGKSVLDQISAE